MFIKMAASSNEPRIPLLVREREREEKSRQ